MVNASSRRDNCTCISKLDVIICLQAIFKIIAPIIYLFTPEKVTNPTSYRKDTDIIYTTWKFAMDRGSCAVEYEIEFLDADHKTVFKQGKISNKEYFKIFVSTNQRDYVKVIQVRATYSGKFGNWSATTIASTITKYLGKVLDIVNAYTNVMKI